MAICRFGRKPDLFVTMTANPKWPEITAQSLPGQQAADRPDIIAHVFVQKKNAFFKEIKEGLFGKVIGMVCAIEFQKCGLPHMHLLIFLDQEDKIRDARDVDSIVSAQIPDPITQPVLYEIVTSAMMHGLCGNANKKAPCMVDGKCSKKYPKDFCDETTVEEDGYPKYARPNNGRTFTARKCV
jgi:hypothetical protein